MIKTWIFEFFPAPPDQNEPFDPVASLRHFNAYLDLWTSAEPRGFEGIFFSEHHFGAGYSPAPHLLIATVAQRTRKIRLGVMGVVPPYHAPWQLVEEIGMLDHLTGGRLEIGTAAGIPQEMAKVGLDVNEARARYDEAIEVLDKALAEPVISHHGRFWNFDNLHLTPPTLQRPSPPRWVTVVSTSSARKAARRGAKLCTGFHPLSNVVEIFDAFRDEAAQIGRDVGPDDLCVRRQVTLLPDDGQRSEFLVQRRGAYRERLKADPRVDLPDRPAVLDGPTAHAFTIGDEEFLAGTPSTVAEEAIRQCRAAGAGHFAAVFDRSVRVSQLADWYQSFGDVTIPMLRGASVETRQPQYAATSGRATHT